MKHPTTNTIIQAHRCPDCGRIVAFPAAIVDGQWYCRRDAAGINPARDALALRVAAMECGSCGMYSHCREWLVDVFH